MLINNIILYLSSLYVVAGKIYGLLPHMTY